MKKIDYNQGFRVKSIQEEFEKFLTENSILKIKRKAFKSTEGKSFFCMYFGTYGKKGDQEKALKKISKDVNLFCEIYNVKGHLCLGSKMDLGHGKFLYFIYLAFDKYEKSLIEDHYKIIKATVLNRGE